MPIGRLALVVLAILAAAWFGVGLRQAHELDQVSNLLTRGYLAGTLELDRADSELSAAGFLYPGQEVPIVQARLAEAGRQFQRAQRIAESVTRREPQNLGGWIQLAGAELANHDSAGAAAAVAQLKRLDPIDIH